MKLAEALMIRGDLQTKLASLRERIANNAQVDEGDTPREDPQELLAQAFGLVGDRSLPPWALRLLRYVPVAVMPALITPMVVWPEATGGAADPARLLAAGAALAVGAAARSMLGAIAAGMTVLYICIWAGL